MVKCGKCRHESPQGMKFCSQCGTPLEIAPAAATAKPMPELGTGIRQHFLKRTLELTIHMAMDYIPRIPFYKRLAPYLELNRLPFLNPWIILGSLGLSVLLGLYPSQYGHIDTKPGIYQIMPIISCINPALGLLSGIVFGISDMAQKMVTNNIYGSTGAGNYIGARIGYVIAYSAVIVSGVLPGVLARMFRNSARDMMARRAVSTADGGQPSGSGLFNMAMLAAMLGGLIGAMASNFAAVGLEFPAFYLRPNPDTGCYSYAVGNLLGGIPSAGVAGGIGGALTPGAAGPSGPESAEGAMIKTVGEEQAKKQKEEKCKEIKGKLEDAIAEYNRCDNIIGELLPAVQEAQKLKGSQQAILRAEELINAAQAHYDYCTVKQSIYWGVFGWWAEGINNLAPNFVFWSGISTSLVGAVGSIAGEKVAAALMALGVSAARIKAVTGGASLAGFTIYAPIAAANYTGPTAREALNDMLKNINDARSVLFDFKLKVNLVLNKVGELKAKYASERITDFDQRERRSKIDLLSADMDYNQCPNKPDTSGLPAVRGLELGWQDRPLG